MNPSARTSGFDRFHQVFEVVQIFQVYTRFNNCPKEGSSISVAQDRICPGRIGADMETKVGDTQANESPMRLWSSQPELVERSNRMPYSPRNHPRTCGLLERQRLAPNQRGNLQKLLKSHEYRGMNLWFRLSQEGEGVDFFVFFTEH